MLARLAIVCISIAIVAGIFREQLAVPFRMIALYREPADRSLVMPVRGVPTARVRDTWDAPRSGGRRHEGQDIFAQRGTPVIAATRGLVVRIGSNALGGNTVTVLGPGGRAYYYAHLDRYAPGLQTGDTVQRGEILGFVGNTGNARSTQPHLHFGVYGRDGALNPMPLLEAGD